MSVTLRSVDYLRDKSIGKKKRKNFFLVKSNIACCVLKSDEIICATKICGVYRLTLRNEDKAIAYGKIKGNFNPGTMCMFGMRYLIEPRDLSQGLWIFILCKKHG